MAFRSLYGSRDTGYPLDGGAAGHPTEAPFSSDGVGGAEPPRRDKKCQSRNERRFEKKEKRRLLQRRASNQISAHRTGTTHFPLSEQSGLVATAEASLSSSQDLSQGGDTANLQGHFGALTTAPGGDPRKLSAHFKELRRKIQRRLR
jgi:hypothetical protein